MDTFEFDIWFDDLKRGIQKELLRSAQIENPKEKNWDSEPLTYIYFDVPSLDLDEID
jgi:hypothetical protein